MKNFQTIISNGSNLTRKEKEEYDSLVQQKERSGTGEWSNIDS
jgi:hypothetical protein